MTIVIHEDQVVGLSPGVEITIVYIHVMYAGVYVGCVCTLYDVCVYMYTYLTNHSDRYSTNQYPIILCQIGCMSCCN